MKTENKIPQDFIRISEMQKLLNCSRQWIYVLCLVHKIEKIRIGKYAYVKLNGKEN